MGKKESALDGLVCLSCLAMDKAGYCEFDRENTRLFFDQIEQRHKEDGKFYLYLQVTNIFSPEN